MEHKIICRKLESTSPMRIIMNLRQLSILRSRKFSFQLHLSWSSIPWVCLKPFLCLRPSLSPTRQFTLDNSWLRYSIKRSVCAFTLWLLAMWHCPLEHQRVPDGFFCTDWYIRQNHTWKYNLRSNISSNAWVNK